ncbi:MAG: thioesterase family protein [Thauera sp.]|jgi:acyl-CoA thioester hydrolase
MARIRIELPASFAFSTDIPLLVSHINYGNHLDNAQLLGLVSEARVRFLKSMGYGELDVEGLGIIVADAALQYRSEAFHGETMRVAMAAGDFHTHGCDLPWQMTEAASGREVARGKTGIVFFDYRERCKAPVPDGFRRRFPAA